MAAFTGVPAVEFRAERADRSCPFFVELERPRPKVTCTRVSARSHTFLSPKALASPTVPDIPREARGGHTDSRQGPSGPPNPNLEAKSMCNSRKDALEEVPQLK